MPISPIARNEDRNYIGLCYIDVVDVRDVVSMPDDVGGNVVGDIVLADGVSWSRIYLEEPGGLFRDAWKVEKGAQLSAATITGTVSKDRLALMPILWKLKHGRYIARLQLRDGPALLMGRPEAGAIGQAPQRSPGEDMASDANGYQVVFALHHRFPVPFHNGTIPDPPTPEVCPTLGELLAAQNWAAIEALLNAEQLDAAEASICSTLCELIDAAITLGTGSNAFTTSGSDLTAFNTNWALDGNSNGKDAYRSGDLSTSWSGTAWVTLDDTDGTGWFQSTSATDHPWEATGWTAMGSYSGNTPPTLTQDGGGGDASAIVDCLSPEQTDVLLEALGAVTSCAPATVQLKDSAGINIGTTDTYASGSTSNKTAPDGTVTVKNLNGDTMGAASVRSNGAANYTAPIPLKFVWKAGDSDTVIWTVTSDEAGTYGTYTSDGGSGALTYSLNGGSFVALSGTITLAVADTIVVRRTITTSAGYSRWVP